MVSTLQFEAGSVAENYRRYLEPVLFAPWADLLVAHAGVRRGDVVVDIASGTGAVARAAAHAAGPHGHVIATDISERMPAYADSTARPGSAPVQVLVGSALALDLPDATADVVLCQQGLQFMHDQLAVLRECRRVLRPGGVVAIAVWAAGERNDPFDAFADALSPDALSADALSPDALSADAPSAAALSTAGRTFSNTPVTMSVVAVVDALCLSGFDNISAGTRSLVVRLPALGAVGDRAVDHTTTSVFGRGFRRAPDS